MYIYTIVMICYVGVWATDYIFINKKLHKKDKIIYFVLTFIGFILIIMIVMKLEIPSSAKLIESMVKKII